MKRNCPICNNEKYNLIFHDHNRREGFDFEADFVKCKNCGMKYLTNVPSFEEIKNKYPDIYQSTYFKIPDIKIIPNNKKILDIGCNFGLQLKPYYLKGYKIHGIDLNSKAINDAKMNLPNGNFKTSTIEESNYPDNYFDIIRTSHVLEHIYDIDSFLKEIYRILKPNKKIIIQVPNGNSLEMKIFGKYSSQSWIPFHLNLFSGKNLKTKLEELKFKNINYSTKPMPWWWILSLRQLIAKNKKQINEKQTIFNKIIMLLIYPLLWVVSFIKLGEELNIKAKKYDND